MPAPVAALLSATGAPPEVTITYGSDIYPGYYLQIQRSADGLTEADGSYTTATLDILHYFSTEEAGRGEITNADLAADGYTDPVSGAWFQQYRWGYETGEVVLGEPVLEYGAWSNELSGSIINITSSSTVTVDEGVALSHLLTADVAFTGSIVGGADAAQFEISGATLRWVANGTKAYTGVDDVYEAEVRFTGASSYRDQTIAATVAQAIAAPAGSSFGVEAKDLSTLFQNNAGSTAVATNDVVGYWGDKSGAGFHMTSVANDATRPMLVDVGGKPFVRFDGATSYLRRLASLGLYSGGQCTVGFAVIGNPSTSRALFGEGHTTDNNQHYQFMSNNGTATRGSMQIRNSVGTAVLANSSNLGSSAFNNTARRLIFVDTGSQVTLYIDGVAQTPVAYTRSGTLAPNMTGIGAWPRGTPLNYFAADVAGIRAYNNTTVSVPDLDTYLASLL